MRRPLAAALTVLAVALGACVPVLRRWHPSFRPCRQRIEVRWA